MACGLQIRMCAHDVCLLNGSALLCSGQETAFITCWLLPQACISCWSLVVNSSGVLACICMFNAGLMLRYACLVVFADSHSFPSLAGFGSVCIVPQLFFSFMISEAIMGMAFPLFLLVACKSKPSLYHQQGQQPMSGPSVSQAGSMSGACRAS